jgi:protein-S-isoprenylcysteine O-methyltransferase Ste14
MQNSYIVLIVVFVVCLFLRTGYELLKEARKIDPENKLIFALIFTTMCALWVSWFALCTLDPVLFNIPETIRWSGLGVHIVGMILAVGALIQLKGLENIKHLVTSGFFKKIRHPMYTGFCLWIIGWSLYHNAVVSLLVGLIGIGNILYWRSLEEARLLRQFGDTYRQYRLTTWF